MTIAVGLFGINMGICATPENSVRIAELAESLGYESLWAPEHVVLPSPRTAASPLDPEYPILDPLLTLALLSGRTRRVQLATGIVILPQRNPVVLAKELASLDVLSSGRLLFGMGVGYLEPEMSAVGVPMTQRGVRATEYLQAMRALWQSETPAFHGDFVDFEKVKARPRPLRGSIPVVVGGSSEAALRRAVRMGDGWYGFRLNRQQTADCVAAIRREADSLGRDLDSFSVTISPVESLSPEILADYQTLGVTRLVVNPPPPFWRPDCTFQAIEDFVHANAPASLQNAD